MRSGVDHRIEVAVPDRYPAPPIPREHALDIVAKRAEADIRAAVGINEQSTDESGDLLAVGGKPVRRSAGLETIRHWTPPPGSQPVRYKALPSGERDESGGGADQPAGAPVLSWRQRSQAQRHN